MTMIIGGYTSNGSFQALTDNIELKKSENHQNQILKSFHIGKGLLILNNISQAGQ